MAGRPPDGTTSEAAVFSALPGEPERGESAPQIDRRPDARIVRSALDEVKAIQTLLSDVYKDAGDGRTLLRELVQNADDAGAERLVFGVFDRGWPQAGNSLLRGPALLVANDGPFFAKHRNALHLALGGSKADDTGKVGRFGVGLKSVFHICEALVYLGADKGILRPGALNPWAGTGEEGDADPIHPDWDQVGDEDLERLLRVASLLLGKLDNGLLQWFPLRCSEHLDRAQDRPYGLGQVCPTAEQIGAWFGRSASLALLLAQCGHIRSIEADRVTDPEKLPSRKRLARLVRPALGCGRWVGRHDDDAILDRGFEVILTADHGNVEGVGIGKPNVGATADERGERVHVFADALLRSNVAEKYSGSLEWPCIGLPEDYLALIAPSLRAFIGEGKRTVAHGGICIEEVIVPYVTISNSE